MSSHPNSGFIPGSAFKVLLAISMAASGLRLGAQDALEFSTYYGDATSGEGAVGLATDSPGYAYIFGEAPAPTPSYSSGLYVAKLGPEDGTCPGGLCWVSILGLGSQPTLKFAITVGSEGVYVGGWTSDSTLIPAGTPGYDPVREPGSDRDPFILRFDRATGALLSGTYIQGSSGLETITALAVGPTGRLYAVGNTQSPGMSDPSHPMTTAGAYDTTFNCSGRCNSDLFLLVFSPDLGTLEYGTYLGGVGIDAMEHHATGIAVDSAGRALIGAYSGSSDFPVTDGSTLRGREDAVLTVIDPLGGGAADLVWSGYVGGGGKERANTVAVGPAGDVWLGGKTDSSDFPGGAGTTSGKTDAFVSRLVSTPSGQLSLVETRLLGGTSDDEAIDIEVDAAGRAYVVGMTGSSNFPVTPGAVDGTFNGLVDAFVVRLDPGPGLSVDYATFLGGSGEDNGRGIGLQAAGSATLVRVGGTTTSTDFPTTPGAHSETYGGSQDAFVASYRLGAPAVCGDGSCDPGEDACSCPEDCGVAPSSEMACADGRDDDCDGLVDCADPDCGGDPACPTCLPGGARCSANVDCCSGNCSNKRKCVGGGAGGGEPLDEPLFVRADADRSGEVDLMDALASLSFLFVASSGVRCLDALDANDDGKVAITDAVCTLEFLFQGGAAPPQPFPAAGEDPTEDALGDCR